MTSPRCIRGARSRRPARPPVPVLVWIYGGGYMSGTSTLDVYNADMVAATSDVIVASMQYRVGAFGFLFLPPGARPDPEDAAGNMGLWDQALAIRWIKDNIAAFGGDPDLISLFGESAGAGSVSLHLLSPITRGLARRGILQSGTLNAPWSFMTGEKAGEVARKLIDDVGCNATKLPDAPLKVMSCMRQVDAKILSTQQWNSYWGILGFPSAPTIDGVFLPKHPLDLLREAEFDQDTEIMIGSNQDEGTYFILYDFMESFDKDGPSFLARDKFIEIVNTIFKNMNRLEREAIIFERTSTNLWADWMGVIHGSEIEYVFGLPLNMSLQYNARERDLSLRITQAYARFALTGKPVMDDVYWPTYSREKQEYFIFNAETSGVGKGPRAKACAFWNDFLPRLRNTSAGDSCDGESPTAIANNSSTGVLNGGGPQVRGARWAAELAALALLALLQL
ncbi:Acetylcholinesterase 2/Carboxyl/Cholinesterase 28 [Frankliniella occidentalis]|nr:Acetylcholinesterase 2/Carboxyl/Cholinesterase 28 [Frankliniella occidentalis]